MVAPGFAEQIEFGRFRIDLESRRLFRDGADVSLRPRVFRVLEVLVRNRGRIVDYEQMVGEAWQGCRVSSHSVTVAVSEIRAQLEEYGSWITCRPKFGYCFELPRADDYVRRGWHCWNWHTREGFENALRAFEQAVACDSADFRALQGIASTYLMLGVILMRSPAEAKRGFTAAFNRAVELCGLTPELRFHHAFGSFVFERKYAAAESELVRLSRESKSAQIPLVLAMIHATLGRLDDALSEIQRARTLDVLLPSVTVVETIVHIFRGEFEAAVAAGKNIADLQPYSPAGLIHYAQALEFAGQIEEARFQYRTAGLMSAGTPWIRALEARFLAKHGAPGDAREILKDLIRIRRTEYIDAYYLALLWEALGERDEAFRELDRAYEENSVMLQLHHVDPKADSLRSDPRYARFRKLALGRGVR